MQLEEIIEKFEMIAHPEGGWYKETYRSNQDLDNGRQLLTSIYFLLTSENPSNFHRIKSDELWYFHAGDSLTVHLLNKNGHEQLELGLDLEAGQSPYHLVQAKTIFGSSIKKEGGFALVSCAVAPGFDFRDFELFTCEDLLKDFPSSEEIITQLTAK
jgi:predicted cupin superfamily sugar epimerase